MLYRAKMIFSNDCLVVAVLVVVLVVVVVVAVAVAVAVVVVIQKLSVQNKITIHIIQFHLGFQLCCYRFI